MLTVVDAFAREAKAMRATFDARFADPRKATGDRFVWDYWHVPGQYTALRTPAWEYFPEPVWNAFHARLVDFGRRVLGCHDVSPPWLSVYVDGCKQELHGDLPHGPFAFVFSLTPWSRRRFTGGETMLLEERALEYWTGFTSITSVEERHLVREVPAKWNRLTVFDPRIPHGVREVRGTHDPREGRLVVHGWFVKPEPIVEGPLRAASVASQVGELAGELDEAVRGLGLPLAGVLSYALTVAPAGDVREVRLLADTTRVPAHLEASRRKLVRALATRLSAASFAKARGPSRVTLPFVFEQG